MFYDVVGWIFVVIVACCKLPSTAVCVTRVLDADGATVCVVYEVFMEMCSRWDFCNFLPLTDSP